MQLFFFLNFCYFLVKAETSIRGEQNTITENVNSRIKDATTQHSSSPDSKEFCTEESPSVKIVAGAPTTTMSDVISMTKTEKEYHPLKVIFNCPICALLKSGGGGGGQA